ncbi:MAG TPA: hypothetical protein VK633_13685 [Verrucomicrobiae bacterium]|nr:hypothetical protein [Verrucomicrobiae bacterium]
MIFSLGLHGRSFRLKPRLRGCFAAQRNSVKKEFAVLKIIGTQKSDPAVATDWHIQPDCGGLLLIQSENEGSRRKASE